MALEMNWHFFFLSFPQGAYILEGKDKHRKYKIYNVLEKKYSGQRNVTFFLKKISLFREMFARGKRKQGFIEKAFVINHMKDDWFGLG